VTDLDQSRLEQLIGVRSSKTGYYAQWRGTRRDLERALAALRSMSEALCVTALGPVPLCDAALDAVGRLFDAEWAVLALDGQALQATVPTHYAWSREPTCSGAAPSAEESAALAARIDSAPGVLSAEGTAGRAAVLGVPMRLDRQRVGTLLVGMPHSADPDRTGMVILETVANHIMAALRNACLFEEGEELRHRAIAGWNEAERRASELARRNEQLRRARGQLARARQAELVSAERHRIARDLHDGVAQCLVGIGMHLEWCHRHLDAASPVYQRVVAGKELARAGLGRARSAVAELSGLEQPGAGLGHALRDLAADFRSAGPLHVSVRVSGHQHQLPLEVEHSLFQIAQEGLWNVVRHAEATRAWLDLRCRAGETRLTISDDGTGESAVASRYLAAAARPCGRHGLRNMAERAAELGGEVWIERRRGGGLRIRVRVPEGAGVSP
jgi:signal transduction histidine kinase